MTASRQVRHRRGTALLLALVTGVLFLATAPSALAHDGLVGTTPAAGATVESSPSTVGLVFSGEPLPLGTLVLVTDADGAVLSEGDAEVRGTSVVQRLIADRPAGTYQVVWRSTSSDGHPLTGTFDFAVATATTPAASSAGPAAPTPDPAAPSPEAATPSPAAAAADVDAAGPGGVWVAVGAVVLVGLGILVAGRLRGRP
ncbi:copper resistance protein CopC [Blastococcus sp. SYSU DS0669]